MPITINGSTGIAGVDGSAGAPAVRGSDADSGVYFTGSQVGFSSNGSGTTMSMDASGNVTFPGTVSMATPFAMRNKIINGAMEIDQRNVGAATTPTANAYPIDRFYLFMSQASKLTGQQNMDAVTPPTGYKNYLGVKIAATATVGAADCFGLAQRIEGNNCADLSYGTAQAKTMTLTFWVRSSVTGTFSGAFQNDALNRSYPYTYTISSANTWEFKTITFVGDTTGTWTTTNATGFIVEWSFGAGANFSGTAGSWNGNNNNAATGGVSLMGTLNATWYVTGVQLEVGSIATPFERRNYQQEFAMCQRYYQKSYNLQTAVGSATSIGTEWFGFNSYSSRIAITTRFATAMRTDPTVTTYDWAGTAGRVRTSAGDGQTGFVIRGPQQNSFTVDYTSGGIAELLYQWAASAEL